MYTHAVQFIGIALIFTSVKAQTYTACDPTNVTCPPTPGLDSTYYFVDFTKVTSTPKDWVVPTWCRVTYNTKGRQNGAELEFLERYDSQQLYSSFSFLFGRIEFVVQAAPGPGIISDMITLSDDLDELDWEFRGTLDDEVQTGWFGKGVTGLYNHSITPKIPTPMTQFHTYAFDWTADRVIWEADGAVVRTLYAADCVGTANQYPQTPMKAMIGLWDAGDPDHYDPWSAGLTPIPPPAGGYSFYVKSVKIWNKNPAACYDWVGHSGSWQSIKAINDSSACGISPKSSSSVPLLSTTSSSSSTILSPSSITSSLSSIITSPSPTTSSSASAIVPISSTTPSSSSKITPLSQATSSSSNIASSMLATSSPSSMIATSQLAISSSHIFSANPSMSLQMSSSVSSSSSMIATSQLAMSSSHTFSTSSSISLQISSSVFSSSSTIATSLSAKSSSHHFSANSSTPLQISSATSSIKLASATHSVTTAEIPSSRASLGTQSSITLASVISLSSMESAGAQIPSTSSPSIHPSFSQPSSMHPPGSLLGSMQSPSTPPLSMLSPTSVKGSTQISATHLSNPIISSTMSNTVLPTQASVHQSPSSVISRRPQTSQTSGGMASISTSSQAGSLGASKATISTTGSIVLSPSSVHAGTPSAFIPSTSNTLPPIPSTPTPNPTHPPPSNPLPPTKPSSPPQTTPAPHWNTITIIINLPNSQTLSYSPEVEELEILILSLEELIRRHRRFPKRDLQALSETSSQSSLLDAAARSHHHGHQHDHLHDQLHRRGAANNSDAAAGIIVETSTPVRAAASSASSFPHPDGQEPYSFVDAMAAVPGSLLPMSQASPASVAGADKSTQSVSVSQQQQDSAAGRVSVWESGVVVVGCVVWFGLFGGLLGAEGGIA